MSVPSPCQKLCQIQPGADWCIGCLRSLDEIAAWSTLTPGEQREIWRRLPQRAMAAGLPSPVWPAKGMP